MKSRSPWILILVALGVLLGLQLLMGRPAETPQVFAQAYSLEQAAQISSETGKPILAVATADWCAPCQTLKRGTLTDPEVATWIVDNTIPVYLEESQNIDAIRDLGVRAYPTTMLLVAGQVVVKAPGAISPGEFMRAFAAGGEPTISP